MKEISLHKILLSPVSYLEKYSPCQAPSLHPPLSPPLSPPPSPHPLSPPPSPRSLLQIQNTNPMMHLKTTRRTKWRGLAIEKDMASVTILPSKL